MLLPARTVTEPVEVESRLKELALTRRGLQEALLEGSRFLASLTEYDTAIIRGPGVYNAISRELAYIYCPQRWQVSEKGGFRRLVHPEDELSVVVHGGDRLTGVPEMQPSNGYPYMEGKRKALRSAVQRNNLIVYEQRHFSDLAKGWGRGLTYLLLHRIGTDEIQAELSLPTRIDDQFIAEFHERILLPDPSEVRDQPVDEGVEETFEISEKPAAEG